MNAGRLHVTYELLAALLRLPENVRIARVFEDLRSMPYRQFDVLIEGDGLPKMEEGIIVPTVSMQHVLHEDGTITGEVVI